MKRTACLGVALVTVVLLEGGCAKSREAAEASTQEFRMRYSRAEFATIYREAALEFRNSSSEDNFVKLLEGVDRKLGAWQSSKPPGWKMLSGTGGRTVTLMYDSQFEKGAAAEEFVWGIHEGRGILLGYHINSPVFVTN